MAAPSVSRQDHKVPSNVGHTEPQVNIGPSVQSSHLLTFRENKVIMKYVGFCQMLFKKPHKIENEVTSDSCVKSSILPFLTHHAPHPVPDPTSTSIRLTHQKLHFPFQTQCTSNPYSLLCVFWFPLWFSFFPGFLLIPTWVSGISFGEQRKERWVLCGGGKKVLVMKRQPWHAAVQQGSPTLLLQSLLPGTASLWNGGSIHPTGIWELWALRDKRLSHRLPMCRLLLCLCLEGV